VSLAVIGSAAISVAFGVYMIANRKGFQNPKGSEMTMKPRTALICGISFLLGAAVLLVLGARIG
jgi:hypothetical protein